MTYRQYLALGRVERFTMHLELCEMIEDANPPTEDDPDGDGGGAPMRPKRMRR
jgi:hypothetical protein